jgi:ABC-type branched-subunit amino acid transport system substrate-binding protein
VASNQHALLGAIISECSLAVMDELAPAGVLGITPGSTSVQLGNLTKYPTFYRLNPSSGFYGQSLAIVLQRVGLDCVTLLSDFEATANAEAAASFKADAQRRNIRIAQEFALPPDGSRAEIRALLLEVWHVGVGVIVLNS